MDPPDSFSESEHDIDEDLELSDISSESSIDLVSPLRLVFPRGAGYEALNPQFISVAPLPYGNAVHHNQHLTPLHVYLGQLSQVNSPTKFDEYSVQTLPVLFLRLHLMPGQIFPIIAYCANIQLFFKYVFTRKDYRFGVSYELNTDGQNTFGTTAVVFEYNTSYFHYPIQHFIAKAMGHQRFKILSVRPFPDCEDDGSLKLATVKILPNIRLSTHPYNKFCSSPRNQSIAYCKRDMWQTQWPKFVYDQFDASYLASHLTKKILMLFKEIIISSDPDVLSFQVMRLGIFSSKQINLLMGIDSTIIRLKRELDYWDENQPMNKFVCAKNGCKVVFCSISNVFLMSTDGPQGIFCNQWGDINSIITVTSLDTTLELTKVEFNSFTCRWFYGYKGLKILCPLCLHHFGWRFEPLNVLESGFYALALNAIKTRS